MLRSWTFISFVLPRYPFPCDEEVQLNILEEENNKEKS